MKRSRVLLGVCALSALFLSGCAATFTTYDPYPYRPPAPVSGSVIIYDSDYWFDGYTHYYYDPGVRLYFWWDSGVRRYREPYWAPRQGWHRYDGNWRYQDPYWRDRPGHWDRRGHDGRNRGGRHDHGRGQRY